MLKTLSKGPFYLQKYMIISIPVIMGLGFLIGANFDTSFFKKLVVPFTFLMVFPSMVTMNFAMLLKGGDTRLQFVTQGMNFVILPLVAWLLGFWFFQNDVALRLALFLTALLPTSGMTISWTNVAKGNLPSAVKMTVIGLIAGSLLAPFYMKLVFGQSIEIPLMSTLMQIALVIFLPMALGIVTQKWVVGKYGMDEFNKSIKHQIGPWGTVGVLGVIFSAIALKAKVLLADPSVFITLGIPMLVFYLLNFGASTALARLFQKRGDGIAFIYGTALRNLSIALAIVMAVPSLQGSPAVLLISIGFILQSQLAAWHVKHLDRILPVGSKILMPKV